jgi:hypothetical protein
MSPDSSAVCEPSALVALAGDSLLRGRIVLAIQNVSGQSPWVTTALTSAGMR